MSESPSLVRPPRIEELVVDDGEPMESYRHRQQMNLLIESLEYGWLHRDDFYVGGNMFFYYSEAQTRKNEFRGPDVFVALGTDKRERQAWVVWLEGGKTPDVIIELTSDSTRSIDRRDKKLLYERLKIGEYFVFDPFSAELDGWELDAARRSYRPKVADAQGRLRSNLLGLDLGVVKSTLWSVEAQWLRWLSEGGVPLLHPWEAALAAEADRQRAEADRQRAEAELAEYERRFGPLK
jgi:Uma2 family endonuclease